MISKIINIHDKQYKIEPEACEYSCKGCAFLLKEDAENSRCTADIETNNLCFSSSAIFTEVQAQPASEEEQKYTLKELIDKLTKLAYSTAGLEYLLEIKEQEQLKEDPEYDKFLELKEKFKSLS